MHMSETSTIRQGDSLWSIANRRYGYGHLWPSVYLFNNWAAYRRVAGAANIVDPNRIRPGDRILLPDLAVTKLRPLIEAPRLIEEVRRADGTRTAGGGGGPSRPPSQTTAQNPAEVLGRHPFWALEYCLDGIAPVRVIAPPYILSISLAGKVLVQPRGDEPLLGLSNKGAFINEEHKASGILRGLTTGVRAGWDSTARRPSFSCTLLVHASQNVGAPKIEVRGTLETQTLECILKYRLLHGSYHNYLFLSTDFGVVFKISSSSDTSKSDKRDRNTEVIPTSVHPRPPLGGLERFHSFFQSYCLR